MKRKKIVTIGGGSGSSMVLKGLKSYDIDITSIVNMVDSGGSTGVLRKELKVLPAGDIRQCLLALSASSSIWQDLLKYRFDSGTLKGHNFGNLFLAALEKVNGNFDSGLKEVMNILQTSGSVVPVVTKSIDLCVKLKNKKVIKGESNISNCSDIQKKGIDKLYVLPNIKANPEAVKAILNADLIVVGPGNHYCSVIPNLLVKGISEAIGKSKSKVVYVSNLVNRKDQTEGFTVDDYVSDINYYLKKDRIDIVVFNNKTTGLSGVEKKMLVKLSKNINSNYEIVEASILSKIKVKYNKADAIASLRSPIQHDSHKLAKILIGFLK